MVDNNAGIKEIGEFIVSDRPLKSTERSRFNNQLSLQTIFHLEKDWLNSLPQNANLLTVGSGVSRLFEKQIKDERSDIQTVSIDPTLGLRFQENENGSPGWYIEEYDDGDYLIYKTSDQLASKEGGYTIPDDPKVYQRERVASVTKIPGAVVALAPELPFRDNSIDIFFDTFGPSRYIQDPEKSMQYLTRLHDVLKVGGFGYINFVNQTKLEFLQSFSNLKVEIIEQAQLKINGNHESIYTLMLIKT